MVWGLSGTLRPNSALDLVYAGPPQPTRGKLWGRSFYAWRKEYFYPADRYGYDWKVFPGGAEDKLNADIAPLTVTLADDELPQLPGLSIIFDRVELPESARKIYDTMEKRLVADIEAGRIVAANAAVATGKLAQIANGFMYPEVGKLDGVLIHEEKRQWLRELKEDATGPTLLIYEFQEDLASMREIFGTDLPCLGDGSSVRDDERIKKWNAGQLPFLALHPASGGHGLNLQHGGADMAWIAPTWSPELWEQTIARLHRSGQAKPVIVRVCSAADTIDQLKINRVHFKMSAQQAFEAYLRGFHADAVS